MGQAIIELSRKYLKPPNNLKKLSPEGCAFRIARGTILTIKQSMLAKHFKIELHECGSTALNDPQAINDALNLVAGVLGVKVIKTAYHLFDPHGITCLFLVSSSHFALHSWPEHKFVMVDIFICGDRVPIDECIEQLKEIFEPGRTEFSMLECGKEY